MKKIILSLLSILMLFGSSINCEAFEIDPIKKDLELYSDEITERVVIYDESTGYLNIEYFIDHPETYELVPIDPGTGLPAYTKYFTKIEWITRSGVVSLSLYSRSKPYSKDDAWKTITASFSYDSKWKNSTSLYNQFVCHYDFAINKTPWNIEPNTEDKGYWGFVLDLCN